MQGVPTTRGILVILPCHNEQGRIGKVLESVRAVLPEATLVVIDDDSTDGTADEAMQAGASVLPHPVNLGYGAALETGYLYARDRDFSVVIQMDGDGQHLAEELPSLLQPILDGSADIVMGSRYLAAARSMETTWVKRAAQILFSQIVRLLTQLRITDPTTGFQALGRRAIELFASGVYPCDYPDADVVTMATMAGLRIWEVPVRMAPREGGASMHSGLRPLYYMMKMLLSIFVVVLNYPTWHRWRRRFWAPAS
jgi:glycosyltransferase involved in cell wall biosynthesis